MKTTLILSGALLFALGCGTTQITSTQHRGSPASRVAVSYPDTRVEGQWAREAGMAQEEWMVKKVPGPEEALQAAAFAAAQPSEAATGGAATAGQAFAVTSGAGGVEIMDAAEIELRKEELVVGKREVSNGGVLVRTIVQTEQVSQPVELRREEYVIERIPAGALRESQASAVNAFQGREIYIPLMREEAVASKRTLLTEAVRIGKRIETDRQTVSMPVRTEDVQVVKNPDLTDPKFSAVPRRAAHGGIEPALPAAPAESGTLKLAREELIVGKQEVDAGGVYLQKVVRTETASQPVDLRREELAIERTPLTGQAAADFRPREIRVDLTREEPVTGTRHYVAETIRVRKQMQAEQQLVSGTVRKESVEVVPLAGQTASAQGGTGSAGQSGVAFISGASSPEKSRDQILAEHVQHILAEPCPTCRSGHGNIRVTADNGVVTLSGNVPSEQEKKAIGKRVNKLSGVRSVNNELGTE